METNELLSKKQVFLSRLTLSVAAIILGVFLLLCGLEVIKIPILKIILSAACFSAAVVCFGWAFIQENTLMLWFAPALIIVGFVSVLTNFTTATFASLYPLYILAPAVSGITTALYSKRWSDHIKYIIFFAASAAIFALHGFFEISLAITVPIFIVFLGISIASYTLTHNKK